ncbi:MAG: TIGR00297 family protein [Prochlorococcus marinus CUG1439]|uniref:TIGR00297 family protein n=1 Tax=Prochlorococcus sp. MIT 1314 TaxID=3096220 RepID=UPI001B108A97|nr:TIGR00297 family protein [Prochlorococcus sp. MIT 1314]MCR8540005.1 TIGR00297 family protein [Prochlorococcus marinus CUG1439]
MDLITNQFFIGFCINFILIYIFCKIPLMTKGGWISAGILGTILWGCLSWQGWMSVVIYLLFGALVTKIGFKFKKERGIAEKRGGRRGPENVWGSAATGLFLAMMTKFNPANVLFFKIGFAASFAAKLADTFGSEIGKRFGKDTYLITSLKKVDRGTEGGISIEGTLASFLGSIFMTFVMLRLSIISTISHFIIVAVSGFLATLSESIIGAKFQNKYKLSNEMVNAIQTSIASIFAIFSLIFFPYFLN